MNAQQAFASFVQKVLVRERAERFTALSATKKGQRKIVESLNQFGPAIRAGARRPRNYDQLWDSPCFVFHQPLGFGVEFATVREAYDQLSLADGWLILLGDTSAGIYRPEARWDNEVLIVG